MIWHFNFEFLLKECIIYGQNSQIFSPKISPKIMFFFFCFFYFTYPIVDKFVDKFAERSCNTNYRRKERGGMRKNGGKNTERERKRVKKLHSLFRQTFFRIWWLKQRNSSSKTIKTPPIDHASVNSTIFTCHSNMYVYGPALI